jgi:hypothetical protein
LVRDYILTSLPVDVKFVAMDQNDSYQQKQLSEDSAATYNPEREFQPSTYPLLKTLDWMWGKYWNPQQTKSTISTFKIIKSQLAKMKKI